MRNKRNMHIGQPLRIAFLGIFLIFKQFFNRLISNCAITVNSHSYSLHIDMMSASYWYGFSIKLHDICFGSGQFIGHHTGLLAYLPKQAQRGYVLWFMTFSFLTRFPSTIRLICAHAATKTFPGYFKYCISRKIQRDPSELIPFMTTHFFIFR